MADMDWAAKLFHDIPEGAVITDAIAIIGYSELPEHDEDNGSRYGYNVSSDAPISTNIGLLELVKADLLDARGGPLDD